MDLKHEAMTAKLPKHRNALNLTSMFIDVFLFVGIVILKGESLMRNKRIMVVFFITLIITMLITPTTFGVIKPVLKKPVSKKKVVAKKPTVKTTIKKTIAPMVDKTSTTVVDNPKTTTLVVEKPQISSLAFDKLSDQLYIGNALKTDLQVKTTGDLQYTIKYRSLNSDIATVDDNGVITGVSAGMTSIIADVNGIIASIDITVFQPKVVKAEIVVPSTMDIDNTSKAKVNITMEPSTAAIPAIKYSVDNSNMVSIDNDGNIAAIGVGTVNVTATINDVTTTVAITVNPKLIDLKASSNFNSINSKFLMVCEKSQIKVKSIVKPSNEKLIAQFSSSDTSIATVDNEGNVIGVNPGKDTITVSIKDKKVEVPIVVYGETTDTDKDGLTDYQEIHKYFTDPEKFSTAGDGVADSDWNRRRQYSYTISTTQQLMKTPVLNLNTEYQDAKIISDDGNIVTAECILYPYTTYDQMDFENKNWQTDNAADTNLKQYLIPRMTTDWDDQMQKDLIKALKDDGIDPDKLSDVELVHKVSAWIMNREECVMNLGFLGLHATYINGKPEITQDTLNMYHDILFNEPGYAELPSLDEKLAASLSGKTMFYRKKTGQCTEYAILYAAIFRALGIPVKMQTQVPLLSQGNKEQQNLVEQGLSNDGIKKIAETEFIPTDGGEGNHYFTYLYVGKHWVQNEYTNLNYNYFKTSIPIHQNTMFDVSEYDKYELYYSGKRPTPTPGGFSMPYSLVSISDLYGVHYKETGNYKMLVKQEAASKNKILFKKNVFIASDNVLKIVGQKTWMDWCAGGPGFKNNDIIDRNMFVIFNDGTMNFSNDMSGLYKDMDTGDKNFLNVKIVNGKLLVYLKAENEQLLENYIKQIDESDLYIEQYINFDKQ